MRHEDFPSLDVKEVMTKTLAYAQAQCGGQVHWISSEALGQIKKQKEDDWLSGTFESLLTNNHAFSLPKAETFDLLHVWFKIARLPQPLKPQMIASAPSRYFVYPVSYADHLCGIFLFESFQIDFPKNMAEKLDEGIGLAAKYIHFAYEHQAAQELSYTDEVTGLNNQRYLPQILEHEIERARREDTVFSLLFLDIDYFKSVNDQRGHLVGSQLLGILGQLLRDQVRASDHAFRYGGDEFILILSGSSEENASRVAERVRAVVEKTRFMVEGGELRLTISIGVASYPTHGNTAAELIRVADQAMYFAKKKSRNFVYVASKIA